MNPASAERLSTLERVGAGAPHDRRAAEAALGRYLRTIGADSPARPIEWARDALDAFERVAAAITTIGFSTDALRDPRIRTAHTAAQARSWPDGDITTLARARWRDALDAVRGGARNMAWDTATARWVGTLGSERFTPGTLAHRLSTSVATYAVDAQWSAIGMAAWHEVEAGRDRSWVLLAEPLSDAFCAGVWRFWVLPDRIVVAPTAPVA